MTKKERQCIETVWQYYRQHGRHDLPWRQQCHLKPYDILVSEVMLQQTQVSRVVPKYQEFLQRWGSARSLSSAPLGDVLRAWQGLGYNRRAKYLKEAAAAVVFDHGGRWPRSYDALKALPGVGPYTAAAVMNFAYNQPTPMIETNLRTVYLHHFFANQSDISDTELLSLITDTLDTERPREWFWALMDYGAYLKQEQKIRNTASRHYKKQSEFGGSNRQLRGAILRVLVLGAATPRKLRTQMSEFDSSRVENQIDALLSEGLIEKRGRYVQLPV